MTENPTQSVPPQSTSFLDDSFARLRSSGYDRDTDSRWFGGVCSGLAQRLGVDPVLIRAAAVVLAFVGGIGLTVYVVLWLLLPDRRGDILAERAVRQGDAGPIALLVLAAFLVLGGLFSIGNGNGWFAPLWLIPVAAIGWFVLARRGNAHAAVRLRRTAAVRLRRTRARPAGDPATPYVTPPPPPSGEAMSTPTQTPPYAGAQPGPYRGPQPGTYGGPPLPGQPGQPGQPSPYGGQPTPPVPPRPIGPPPPPRPRRRRPSSFVGLVSLGIALVGIGLGAALDDPLGFPGSSATLGFLIALTGVSVVVLTLGIKGRASGFSGFLVVVLSLMLVAASAASRVEIQDGVGDRTWAPVSVHRHHLLRARGGRCDARPPASSTQPRPRPPLSGSPSRWVPASSRSSSRTASTPGWTPASGFGDITHRGGIDGTDTSGGRPQHLDRHRRAARAGRRRRRARTRPDHHPGAVMNTPTTPPTPDVPEHP